MNKNRKNFNIYVFLSTFARNLIELFIPIILYKFGYSLKEVIFYYLLVNVFSLVISTICLKKLEKMNYKIFSFVGILAFLIMQILLNTITYSVWYLVLLGFLFALYRRGYWISRRFYNLFVISNKNVSMSYTIICIINQLGVVFASYRGALLLDFVSITALTVISITLFIISIIPLYFIDVKNEYKKDNIKYKDMLKDIGFKRLYLFGTYELLNVIKFLFPLYLTIYVKDTYQTVGFFSLFTNLATLIFAYMYGKKINNNRNFLNLSILLVVIIYMVKANTVSYLLILVSFLEGLFTKMHELSINKNYYELSKKYDFGKYNFVYENTQNLTRSLVVLLLLFVGNIKVMIYINLIFILLGVFINDMLETKNKTVH